MPVQLGTSLEFRVHLLALALIILYELSDHEVQHNVLRSTSVHKSVSQLRSPGIAHDLRNSDPIYFTPHPLRDLSLSSPRESIPAMQQYTTISTLL